MGVYIDDYFAPYGRMLMSHMIADTQDELFDMVDKIGVERKWVQDFDTYREHFDISKAKRELAIKNGAKQVTARELVSITLKKKEVKGE